MSTVKEEEEEKQAPLSEEEEEEEVAKESAEEEEEEQQEDEDEDVYVGVPTKATQPIDDFWGRIGGNVMGPELIACPKCKRPDACRETVCVSAPFADLETRLLALVLCKACMTWFVRRHQTLKEGNNQESSSDQTKDQGDTAVATPVEKESVWGEAPAWGEEDAMEGSSGTAVAAAAPTDAELEALFGKKATIRQEAPKPATSSKNKKKKHKKKQTIGQGMLLDFISEPDEPLDGLKHEKALLDKYQQNAGEWGEQAIDLSAFKKAARKQKVARDLTDFFERIALAPKQRVRYSFMGQPLWPMDDFKPKAKPVAPDCECCGAPRGFEFQVTPQAVEDFQKITGMEVEFSSILVFACEDSCDEGSTEFCIVCPAI